MLTSLAQLHRIELPGEECQELQKLSLDIQLADARLRRLTAQRDEILLGWQQQHGIADWRGWKIDLNARILTPPTHMDNGVGSV